MLVLIALGLPLVGVQGSGWRKNENDLKVTNRRIKGQVVDYTFNHAKDNRIWSRALNQRRDLYVYLPPGYDAHQHYPLMLYLHSFAFDEQSFLQEVVPLLDEAIVAGKLPPLIVAAPDGSLYGEPCFHHPGSFFLNTRMGDFEEFVLQDVWDFVVHRYSVHPDRKAHILAGVSMGGFASFNLGIRHRNAFGVVIGVFPALNLRWVDTHGDYFADFDPRGWGWRMTLENPREPIGKFAAGLFNIRVRDLLEPLFGRGSDAIHELSANNPIELVDRTRLKNGELDMYVAYAGRDEFNIDAQVESFLYLAKYRGLDVGVGYAEKGRHNEATAKSLFPGIVNWLAPRLAPYSPAWVVETAGGHGR
jgi:pimeloyl-ACP methyl ester carboxylesterase